MLGLLRLATCASVLVAAAACDSCFCGTTWTDADTRCHATCTADTDCSRFGAGERCFASCTACGSSPTPPPTPVGPCADPIIPTGSCATLGRRIGNYSIFDPQIICGGSGACRLNCTGQNAWPAAGTDDATCAIGSDGAVTLQITGDMASAGYFTLNVPLRSHLYPSNSGGHAVLGAFDLPAAASGISLRYEAAVPLSVQIRPAWCLHGGAWMEAYSALPPTAAGAATVVLSWAQFTGQTGAQCDGENPTASSATQLPAAANRNLTLTQAFSFVLVALQPSRIRVEALDLVEHSNT